MTQEERQQYIKDIERVRREAKADLAKKMIEAVKAEHLYDYPTLDRNRGDVAYDTGIGDALNALEAVAKAEGIEMASPPDDGEDILFGRKKNQ